MFNQPKHQGYPQAADAELDARSEGKVAAAPADEIALPARLGPLEPRRGGVKEVGCPLRDGYLRSPSGLCFDPLPDGHPPPQEKKEEPVHLSGIPNFRVHVNGKSRVMLTCA